MNVNVMSTFDLTVSSKLDLAQVRTVLNVSLTLIPRGRTEHLVETQARLDLVRSWWCCTLHLTGLYNADTVLSRVFHAHCILQQKYTNFTEYKNWEVGNYCV